MTFYSESGMSIVRNVLFVSIAVAILLAPVFLLFLVHMSRVQMVFTAAAFIVPFAVILNMTGAKDVEVFVGSATYVFHQYFMNILTHYQVCRSSNCLLGQYWWE